MLELILQDFINAWSKLDRDTFCQHIEVPVLVANKTETDLAFQSEATQFVDFRKTDYHTDEQKKFILAPGLPVLEIRQTQSGPKQQVRLGRAEENDLVIVDETVSAFHAVLFVDPKDPSGVKIQDLESTNGTQINKTVLVSGRISLLHEGDLVSFGDSEFVFFSPGGLYDELNRQFLKVKERPQIKHSQRLK